MELTPKDGLFRSDSEPCPKCKELYHQRLSLDEHGSEYVDADVCLKCKYQIDYTGDDEPIWTKL